jgi:hypothetical protein
MSTTIGVSPGMLRCGWRSASMVFTVISADKFAGAKMRQAPTFRQAIRLFRDEPVF